jgi:hypothetical protein
MKKDKNNHIIFNDNDLDECDAVSATDCTGLIPSAPNNDEELEAYNEIIAYSPKSANVFNSK